MGLFVSIYRWTPEQADALDRRWEAILKGTAPKAVRDAYARMKIITQVVSPQNGFSLAVLEVTDQTWVDGSVICAYLSDVCTQETYPVCSIEQYLEVKTRLSAGRTRRKKR
jgi:hypothetical protein